MAMDPMLVEILKVVRENAMVGLDQNDIDGYKDNLIDTIAELFPAATNNYWAIALETYDDLVKGK
jgi:hypothetical protein